MLREVVVACFKLLLPNLHGSNDRNEDSLQDIPSSEGIRSCFLPEGGATVLIFSFIIFLLSSGFLQAYSQKITDMSLILSYKISE
jgi:hypothetical protein